MNDLEFGSQTKLDLGAVASGFGLYVHIPFCTTRCDYCAFATWTDHEDLIDEYVDALCLEIARAKESSMWRAPATVFFGGGTPSLLTPDQVRRILLEAAPLTTAEITLECNPESTQRDLLSEIAQAGVNRVSLGVQSRKEHVLRGLGRHSVAGALERALDAISAARITNYNIDLVYGGAGESTQDFVDSLTEVLDFSPRPTHISAYALTVEAGTPLAKSPERHPDEDLQAERYERADEILGQRGYDWYEISNWSLPGYECRHNLSCWLGGEYLGVGCAAHSHVAGERFANVFNIDRYVETIDRGESTKAKGERLKSPERSLELLELAMRTRVGIPTHSVEQNVISDGLMVESAGQSVLTLRGRMLANEVAMRLRPQLA